MTGRNHTLTCDRRQVGLVFVRDGRVLLAAPDPARPAAGFAPPAAHCDGLTWPEAGRELCERLGLTGTAHKGVAEGWRPDTCERPEPGGQKPGHTWLVYRATGTGEPRDQRGKWRLRWATRDQLRQMADMTVAYAHGVIGLGTWRAEPGLAPVWFEWLVTARLIEPVTSRDRGIVNTLLVNQSKAGS